MKKNIILIFTLFSLILPFSNCYSAEDTQTVPCNLSKEETGFLLDQVKSDNKDPIRALNECKKNSRQLFAQIISLNPSYFSFASDNLKDDEVFVSKFVAQNPIVLQYVSERLKSDRFFMEKMARIYPNALKYAASKLVDNKGFMKQMIKINPRNFEYASARLQDDEAIALLAVSDSGKMLKYASDRLQDNKKVVTEAINSYSLAINFASERLQKDKQIKALSEKINYKFLDDFENFLKNNYGGIAVGPDGSRGYHIVNMAKFFPEKQLIYQPLTTKWETAYRNGAVAKELKLAIKNSDNFGWQENIADYPDLVKEIENIFAVNKVDQNTVSALNIISLWEVSQSPKVLAFDLYLFRNIDNKYLSSDFANITSLTAIAELKKNKKWEVNIVSSVFDADLKMDIAYKNGHKKYKIWDIYKSDVNDKNPKILFKVEDKNAEYFELFVKQLNGRYATIYRGGGYAIDVIP